MNNQLHELARDPSCLLCLTPENGGTWYCPTRPPKLRDFSKPYNWDTLQQALRDLPWNDDYHFEFEFTIDDMLENGRNWIMYQSEGRIAFFMDKDARGSRFTIGTFSFSGGAYIYTTFQPSLAGKHKVIVTVIGDMLRVTVDDVIYEQTGERVASSAYDRAVTTSGPIIFHNISLTNDTSQTVLWTSAYTDLYDTLIPQPSAIPRNFAEEPAIWRDFMVYLQMMNSTDFTFEIEYDLKSVPGDPTKVKYIWCPINGNYSSATIWVNNDSVAIRDFAYYPEIINRYITSNMLGKHTVKITQSGNVVQAFYDGVLLQSLTLSGTLKPPSYAPSYPADLNYTPQTNADCTVTYVKFSCGDVVWSYPSEAERVRLITKTNVRTDRGAFEAADETQPARVDTALDLRGKVSSYTLFVEFDAAALENESDNYCKQELAGQGASKGSIPSPLAVNYNKQLNVDTLEYRLEVSVDIAGARHLSEAILPGHLAGRNSVVAVVELMDDKTRLSIYHCGVLLKSEIVDGIPKMEGYACPDSFALMDNRNGLWSNYYGKIHSCLLFDRALSAAEIAALTSHSIGGI